VINGCILDKQTLETHITMPLLQHLHIPTHGYNQMPGLLGMISAPLLHSLFLDNVVASDIKDIFGIKT
jgi:hypothetical protein